MWFFNSSLFVCAATQVSTKVEKLKLAEKRLIEYAHSHYTDTNMSISTFDTKIRRSTIVSLEHHNTDALYDNNNNKNGKEKGNSDDEDPYYVIHSVKVTSNSNESTTDSEKSDLPLVLLHGYMNGGAYFYRNFAYLSQYFSSIYALDLLGWGLSSRPEFKLKKNYNKGENDSDNDNDNNKTYKKNKSNRIGAEDFFVESIEEWRKQNNISKFILAGHSMGGYISVAYCEKYPQYVDRLILISPVGVPELTAKDIQERKEKIKQYSLPFRMFVKFWISMFGKYTPGDVIRSLPESTGQKYARNYVVKRMPSIDDSNEQEAIADYLYHSNTLPGSGEYCLDKILNESVHAHEPLQYRIPKLSTNIKSVGFLYGEHDWMDKKGGLAVQQITHEMKQQQQHQNQQQQHAKIINVPEINVYTVSESGHLLMLENPQEFNHALLLCTDHNEHVLKNNRNIQLPTKLHVNSTSTKQTIVDDNTTTTTTNERPALKTQVTTTVEA